MMRPHNNPWEYPPTVKEFEEQVRRFRRSRGGEESGILVSEEEEEA